jgi:hypothetical protein
MRCSTAPTVLMLPDFDRADRIGSYWAIPRPAPSPTSSSSARGPGPPGSARRDAARNGPEPSRALVVSGDHAPRRPAAACSSTHRKDHPMRRATARYQSPTSGPRSISPESPGGSGNDARLVASSSAPITPPVVANTRPNRGCRHMLRASRKVPNEGNTSHATSSPSWSPFAA